ncbi:MAG: hypothetical protein FVQ83_08315 [Chloroflexi bacterium]|nr:hypothetical protein [Chloroflexota bacterium]
MNGRLKGKYLIIPLFSIFLLIWGQAVSAQSSGQRYFPETGYWVSDDFLEFYQSHLNPEFVYGYPISVVAVDSITGLRMQYFQRARFEYHPENAPGERIVKSHLGELVYQPGSPIEIAANNPACRPIGSSPFPVCYSFLEFYEAQGGFVQFGFPISGLEFFGGRIVQYFQNARIEWYPEYRPGFQITLGNLGEVYFLIRNNRGNFRESRPANGPRQFVLQLSTHAFLESATLSTSDTQTIFVSVRDQNLEPVPQAQVSFVVRYPSNEIESTIMPDTDENGISMQSFSFDTSQLGVVEVIATVIYDDITRVMITSFRLWW